MLRDEAQKGLTACYGLAAVSWLILLAGLSAMQDTYGTNVRSVLGLPWYKGPISCISKVQTSVNFYRLKGTHCSSLLCEQH